MERELEQAKIKKELDDLEEYRVCLCVLPLIKEDCLRLLCAVLATARSPRSRDCST
jgi:hypothetical protein